MHGFDILFTVNGNVNILIFISPSFLSILFLVLHKSTVGADGS